MIVKIAKKASPPPVKFVDSDRAIQDVTDHSND